MGDLKIGSAGADVVELQKRLAARGFNPGAVDGSFGVGRQKLRCWPFSAAKDCWPME